MSASGERPAPTRRGPAAERGAWLRIREPLPAWMPWVLGVVLEGQARAYSLNLLNRHEVINDRIADQPIAAVW